MASVAAYFLGKTLLYTSPTQPHMKKGLFFWAVFTVILLRCNINTKVEIPKDAPIIPAVGAVPDRTTLPQDWSDETREKFWYTSQGAQIMPYVWFTYLEQADSKVPFRQTEHMASFGYLPMEASKYNPSGLPIGFTVSRAKSIKESYVGLTCAACHTNQIDYGDKKYLIDGAPTLADFVGFFDATVAALNATYKDDEKFDRFARNVLTSSYDPGSAKQLRDELLAVAEATSERQGVNALPKGYPTDFTSYGRLDAFTNIENAGTAFALGDLSNANAPVAPVSYPFLWGTHQSDVVQWDASAPNTPVVGPLVRNVGEVVGVFGGLKIERATGLSRLFGKKVKYSSTVDFHGLGALEGYVKTLRSPRWTDTDLPALDPEKLAMGAILFDQHCQSCHQVISYEDQGEHYKAAKTPLLELGTDPATAWHAAHNEAKSEILEGRPADVLAGKRFGPTTTAISVPVNGVIGLVLKNPVEALEAPVITGEVKVEKSWKQHVDHHASVRDEIVESRTEKHQLIPFINNNPDSLNLEGLVYKGRPLNGIWATAPYLHNGAIPDLWSLLMPETERPTEFWVGDRQLDPVKVGFRSDQGLNRFKVLDKDGNILPGNSNRGHRYGTQLSEAEKWALVEYMKSL